ncbi:MAG: orotidine 5'-phosphate decarboxylase, partial [Methanomicrobiales archaeon]|nr:orotidine 5'-phosphate decarboxylase [Methanomicrobiales archaeon]
MSPAGRRGRQGQAAEGIPGRPVLQVALDLLELDRAVVIAREAISGGADWVEAGTPLIKSAGMEAVRRLREEFPGREIVADMKVADTGTLEVEMAAKSGAGIVCILATADDEVVREAVRAKHLYGVRIMADLINSPDPVSRAVRLEELGVDIIAAHAGIDQQMVGITSVDLVKDLAGKVSIPIAVAGGLDADSA